MGNSLQNRGSFGDSLFCMYPYFFTSIGGCSSGTLERQDVFIRQFVQGKRKEFEKVALDLKKKINCVKEEWIAAECSELTRIVERMDSNIESISRKFPYTDCHSCEPEKDTSGYYYQIVLKNFNVEQDRILQRKAELEAVLQQEKLPSGLIEAHEELELITSFIFELKGDLTIEGVERKVEDIKADLHRARETWVVEEDLVLLKLEQEISKESKQLEKMISEGHSKNPYCLALNKHIGEVRDDILKHKAFLEAMKQPESGANVTPSSLIKLQKKFVFWHDLSIDLCEAVEERQRMIIEAAALMAERLEGFGVKEDRDPNPRDFDFGGGRLGY